MRILTLLICLSLSGCVGMNKLIDSKAGMDSLYTRFGCTEAKGLASILTGKTSGCYFIESEDSTLEVTGGTCSQDGCSMDIVRKD